MHINLILLGGWNGVVVGGMILPALALLALIIPTFAQRPIAGHVWIVLLAPGHGFLSAASDAVATPTGIQMAAFLPMHLLGMPRQIFTPAVKHGTRNSAETHPWRWSLCRSDAPNRA
jgi:hypothetical protein